MKYTLLKKWHPSQVEEVGYEFEEDPNTKELYYRVKNKEGRTHYIDILAHEIALLCEAGYLKEYDGLLEAWKKDARAIGYEDPQLELWTEEPPMNQQIWFVYHFGVVGDKKWDGSYGDKFILRTKNCHRTQKSAEEALKRLLEQE